MGGESSCTTGMLLPSQPHAWHFTHSKLCISSPGDGKKNAAQMQAQAGEKAEAAASNAHPNLCHFPYFHFSMVAYIYNNAWVVLLVFFLFACFVSFF